MKIGQWIWAALLALMLGACGGGGSDAGTSIYDGGTGTGTDSEPINLQGLAQLESVQDRFAAVLKAGRALIGRPQAQAERPAWCTFDLHIVCKKT